jgi:MFS family permease
MWGFGTVYLAIGLAAGIALALETTRTPAPDRSVSETGDRRRFSLILTNRTMHAATAISAMSVTMSSLRTTLLPLYAQELGLGPGAIGPLFSLQSGASLVTRPFLSSASTRFGRRRLLYVGATMIGFGLGLIPITDAFAVWVIASAVFGVGSGLVQPLAVVLVLAGTEDRLQHLALSVWLTSNRAVMLVSPLLYSLFWVRLGVRASFLGPSAVFLGAAYAAFKLWESEIEGRTVGGGRTTKDG